MSNFKVNFLVVGAAKSGTTAMAKFLSKHPEVLMARCKEVRYFSTDHFFSSGSPDYSQYHRYFQDTSGEFFSRDKLYIHTATEPEGNSVGAASGHGVPKAIGEATPMYMWWKPTPERIYRYNPAMKLIFIFRNPVERAYSHYRMLVKKKKEWLPFALAIRVEPIRTLFCRRQIRGHAYLGRGMYGIQVRRMMQFFPREQMLFLKTEDLRRSHQKTMAKACAFLGVSPFEVAAEEVYSLGKTVEISSGDLRWLWSRVESDVRDLETLTGLDCSSWRPA